MNRTEITLLKFDDGGEAPGHNEDDNDEGGCGDRIIVTAVDATRQSFRSV